MAKPKKPSPLKQKPAAGKKPSPKKEPAKAEPAKPVKKVSAHKKTAAKKPAVKEKAAKVKKTTVQKEPKQKPSTKKSAVEKQAAVKPAKAKPSKAATPAARAAGARKTPKAGHKQPEDTQSKATPKAIKEPGARETGKKDKDDSRAETGTKRAQLRNRILVDHKKAFKPVTFTLDEAREIAKQHAATAEKTDENAAAKTTVQAKANAAKLAKAAAPMHVKAASLADILGFNPKKAKPAIFAPVESVPEKYRRFYKELLDLRGSLTEGLDLHTEQTLRRSTKEDAGDLSSYGQHMADAGTDTFDRDFALSMVANEQEALTEIDAAINRIQNGTYGICEITNKPIAKDRLLAVPFTRYSAEAQKDLERNRMRVRTAAGLFGGEISDDNGRVDDSGGGDEE